jgi:hypothetical protein
MCPAIKRPIRSAAPDIGLEVSAHGFRGQECVNSALSYLAVVVVGALEQDDHVLGPRHNKPAPRGCYGQWWHIGKCQGGRGRDI